MVKSSGISIYGEVIKDISIEIELDLWSYTGDWNIEVKRINSNNILHTNKVFQDQEFYTFNNLAPNQDYEYKFTKDNNVDPGRVFTTKNTIKELPPSIGEIQVWNDNNSISLYSKLNFNTSKEITFNLEIYNFKLENIKSDSINMKLINNEITFNKKYHDIYYSNVKYIEINYDYVNSNNLLYEKNTNISSKSNIIVEPDYINNIIKNKSSKNIEWWGISITFLVITGVISEILFKWYRKRNSIKLYK